MKCPACGFDTPEEQGWCDFCKEPFRKKKDEPSANAPGAAKPAPVKKVELPPGVLEKLTIEKLAMGKQLPPGIPPEFAVLDQGERIPEVAGAYRKLAWVFLAMILFLGLVVGTVGVMKSRRRGARPGAAPPPPPPSPPSQAGPPPAG